MTMRTLGPLARAALGIAALSLVAPAVRAQQDDDLAALASGQSRKTNWQPPGLADRYGHAEVLVHAPIGVVHKAVLDYGHYKDLVPDKFHNARVIGKEDGGTDVYMQVPIMHGMITLWQVMRWRDLKPLATGWAIVEGWFVKGNIKNANAAWTMHAIDDEHTVLKFDLLMVLNMPAPQAAIDEELRDAAMQAVDAIRDRAQVEAGGQAGPSPLGH
jgi:hypothetical protein